MEEVRCAHPAVAEAAVVGMRDALMGEEVCAFVALKRSAAVDAQALMRVLRLAAREVQVSARASYVAAEESRVGKILRKELRALVG